MSSETTEERTMVGIQSVGGMPEPVPEKPSKVKSNRDSEIKATQGAGKVDVPKDDQVVISSEAQAAAELARLIQMSKGQDAVRVDKVEQAKQHLAQGEYKKPEVVQKIAEKILKILR